MQTMPIKPLLKLKVHGSTSEAAVITKPKTLNAIWQTKYAVSRVKWPFYLS
ncbi:hypothetical protein NTE_00956 [Candidatus Nitrososphaera evergladensis SR1]|uniref:Uncharacterized protein n=1 Tax=Candidatus Nitrososphaera evergladensis SR1 TaxID=1459636 RepID=A0A075MNA5_9ARCH|nr:hypothetical protein NTE_00956 [Candidatus Nitrososphaera evergladensis SR1]